MRKHLHECLGWDGPVTHRQHQAWMEFLYPSKERAEPKTREEAAEQSRNFWFGSMKLKPEVAGLKIHG